MSEEELFDEPEQGQPWGVPSDEEHEEGDRALVRTAAGIWAGDFGRKAPRGGSDSGEWSDLAFEKPDLGAYFESWDMDPKQQVLACRSYASYLNAVEKAKPLPHNQKKFKPQNVWEK